MYKSEHALELAYLSPPPMQNTESPSWNSGQHVGAREAWTPVEAQAIVSSRRGAQDWHDACLASVGIDLMWREGDLLSLRVSDLVFHYGEVRTEVRNRQEKTDGNVKSYLGPIAQQAVSDWIRYSGKQLHHYVFTRRKRIDSPPISKSQLRRVVKSWVKDIGGNPERYSGHTLRRTKAVYLFKYGFASIEVISELLGHNSVSVTRAYIGITSEEAKAAALKGDILKNDITKSPLTHPLLYHFMEPSFLEPFAEALAERIAPKVAEILDKTLRKGTK